MIWLFLATVLLGLSLAALRRRRAPWCRALGLAHRLLALTALVAAWRADAPVLVGGALVVAAFGVGAARLRDEAAQLVCLLAHAAAALTLLVLAGLSRG